jgi:hypothetical protein
VIVPSIAINYPKITVTSRRPEQEENAQIVEAVANYYWRHFDVHDEFRVMIKDFSIVGHGWLKTTWAYSEKEVELSQEEWKQAAMQALLERAMGIQQAKAAGMSEADFPTEEEVIKGIPTKKTVAVQDNPAVERVSPFDVYVDPAATRLKDARWVAQRTFVPLEVAQENEAWDAKARGYLKGTAITRDKVDVLREGESRTKEADFVTVWEFYDLINETMCTFAEDCEGFLLAPEPVPFAFKHPFVMVTNYSVPEKFYPIGDVETIAQLQQELAITRTQMINDRKRFRRLYLIREDEIGSDGMNSLLSGDDNAFINVESDRPFSDVFAPAGTSALPPESYNQTAMILDDINLVSGVSEYMRGSVTEIRRTATEASMIQDAANARSSDKLSIIERAIGEVAQRVVQLAQENLTSDQVAKIINEDGATDWVPYDREAIAGEFDFEVEAGSTQPQNETFRRQSALQLMETMLPFVQMGVVDPRSLVVHTLKNGFGIKTPEQFLIPPPPPTPGMPGQMPGEPGEAGMPPDPGMAPGGPPMM